VGRRVHISTLLSMRVYLGTWFEEPAVESCLLAALGVVLWVGRVR
jgi:hypothetical protein